MTKRRIVVDRKALEINKGISDTSLHHPPIIIDRDGFPPVYYREAKILGRSTVVYDPDNPLILENDQGDKVTYTVWIETTDGILGK